MNFKVGFSESSRTFTVDFGITSYKQEYSAYEGDYVVKPKFEEQTLPTRQKVMGDDVTVNAIEVSRVTNQRGGKTVYIGGLING